MCRRLWLLALGVCVALAPAARAGAPAAAEDARKLAERIDRLIDAPLARAKAPSAPIADDAALLRRLTLDVVGRVPTVAEVRRHLDDQGSDKFERALERLLDSPGYANHFTNIYRDLLLPEAAQDLERAYLVPGMENWLRRQFRDNVSYDKMVREILTLPLSRNANDGRGDFEYFNGGGNSPMAFYLAKEGKPEEIASASARLFLGVRIECAQCHDHPFAEWRREQFWGQAAFFAGVRGGKNGIYGPITEVPDRRELPIPNDPRNRVAQAVFLDGTEPRWKYKVGARETYADWLTAPDNPFFARAAVNRLWAHFFGVGLVDPVDNFDPQNPASHPELLDALAREFVAHGYDFKFMIRAITLSRAYRRSSVAAGPLAAADARLFGQQSVRGLSPDQLFDSLTVATGYRDPFNQRRQRFFNPNSPRGMFLAKFQTGQEKATEHRTSIPQALAMMNNSLIVDLTHPDKGEILAAVSAAPFMETPAKLETLYLAVLGRKPRPAEVEKFVPYIEAGGAAGSQKQALADVYWALLNSPEFILNH
jgi:hypothetical protein